MYHAEKSFNCKDAQIILSKTTKEKFQYEVEDTSNKKISKDC